MKDPISFPTASSDSASDSDRGSERNMSIIIVHAPCCVNQNVNGLPQVCLYMYACIDGVI